MTGSSTNGPDQGAAHGAMPSLVERWSGVYATWLSYQGSPQDGNTYVEFLISLDSFINYANEGAHTVVVEAAREAMQVMETLQDSENPPLITAEQHMQKVTGLVACAPTMAGSRITTGPGSDEVKTQWVVLYWPNADEASDIISQMEHYGYNTSVQPSIAKAVQHAISKNAAMLVADVTTEPLELVKPHLQQLAEVGLQWTAVTDNGQFKERLELVRMAVANVLTKPITAAMLVDAIDRSARNTFDEPYRVLVIDDSPVVHHFVEQTLGSQGVETLILSDITQILTAMHDFFPDLLLLDLRLPGCSGLEVAQIIRQHESFVSIPIVYLSAETNKQIQLDAIRQGGDEFLVKPVQAEHLLATVFSKIERYRMLRRFMVQDSLTGLLNHTRIKQHLAQSVLLAKRDMQPLSFAMIDIDHFKRVNDNYGHPVGDRVIKSLAKLLRQRVRKSDVVGRYGGEEFAVVLHGAKIEDAHRTMDRIRNDFSTIYHPYDNGIFGATFSCGIASFPTYDDPTIIAAKADMALYESKRGGRNRVTMYMQPLKK